MKKLIFLCTVCLCAIIQTNAQMRDTTLSIGKHKVDADLLFQKAKHQKTAAWILIGGGAGLTIAGLSIMTHDAAKETANALATVFTLGLYTAPEVKHSVAGPILAIAGTGAMLGSIPLFTASAKNKRKAHLILKEESVFFNPQLNIKEHLLSVGLKINL